MCSTGRRAFVCVRWITPSFWSWTSRLNSPCVGVRIEDLAGSLPHEAVLVSVRRANGEVIIPHGDTVLESGDRVVAFADEDAARQLADSLLGSGAQ